MSRSNQDRKQILFKSRFSAFFFTNIYSHGLVNELLHLIASAIFFIFSKKKFLISQRIDFILAIDFHIVGHGWKFPQKFAEKLSKSCKIWIYDITWRQLVTGEEAKLLQKSTTAVEEKKSSRWSICSWLRKKKLIFFFERVRDQKKSLYFETFLRNHYIIKKIGGVAFKKEKKNLSSRKW